jgi:hypothetical protein
VLIASLNCAWPFCRERFSQPLLFKGEPLATALRLDADVTTIHEQILRSSILS